ncbi:MAG: CinA family protein [Chloroflexi bacterium]|nr:CinA family protein [Chloroflexota bacterium]
MTSPSLESQIGQILAERKLTLAAAESCTGGLISHRITNVPGSSAYFLGGVVAYSYEAKEHALGVHHNTLYDHGAVSKETAIEMARGARRVFSADIAVAVTGIAGPGGGLPNKPVGLTWIALSAREGETARQFVWNKDREGNKADSAEAALGMVMDYLAKAAPP